MSVTRCGTRLSRAFLSSMALLLGIASVAAPEAQANDQIKRGEYLARIMDCGGCHNTGAFTPQPNLETPLAGSEIGFEVPGLGVFFPPNLTPDHETGLGNWSKEEIIAAVTTGARPDGRELAPAMPWRSYSALNTKDAAALVAYLKSLTPVSHKVPGPFGPDEKKTAPYFTVAGPQ
ncbi:c-type cytochrome [Dongia soli]|uniref:C-type cytochrome n=1 Tax=Dongia soli TaxID=600628 RepID=A0ABU5E733_9PROT|nr:c-type cytochrome [Dongia soli]MDY0882115.1 c-type cytochrome [Dongia soli]